MDKKKRKRVHLQLGAKEIAGSKRTSPTFYCGLRMRSMSKQKRQSVQFTTVLEHVTCHCCEQKYLEEIESKMVARPLLWSVTGRMSSSRPNLQNIPLRTRYG